jgi:hypothetical protein
MGWAVPFSLGEFLVEGPLADWRRIGQPLRSTIETAVLIAHIKMKIPNQGAQPQFPCEVNACGPGAGLWVDGRLQCIWHPEVLSTQRSLQACQPAASVQNVAR